MLLVINLFCHVQTSVLCFVFPALEELIILTELHSIIYLQGNFSVICVHVLMSIADLLWGFRVLTLISICILTFGPDKWHPFLLRLWLMLVFRFVGQIKSLHPYVQFSLTSVIYIFLVLFLSFPDTHDFSMTVVSKCCYLLVSYGLNKVKMSQILFTFIQSASLWEWMCEKEKICFNMLEMLRSHPFSYSLCNFCSRNYINDNVNLIIRSAVSQIICRNKIAGSNNWYCFKSVSLKITEVKC